MDPILCFNLEPDALQLAPPLSHDDAKQAQDTLAKL